MLLHVQDLDITGTATVTDHVSEDPVTTPEVGNSDDLGDLSEPEEWVDAPDSKSTKDEVSKQRLSPDFEIGQVLDIENTGYNKVFQIAGTVGAASCGYLCPCRCHLRTPLETPRWLRDLCGYLFTSHIAVPCLSRRSCNLPTCKRSGSNALQVSYMFPAWIMRRMLVLSMTWKDLSGQGASWTIRMPRVVPYYASIWESIRSNRGLAVRNLLADFRSSPFDIRHDGTTLLYVCPFPARDFNSKARNGVISATRTEMLTPLLACLLFSSMGYSALCPSFGR